MVRGGGVVREEGVVRGGGVVIVLEGGVLLCLYRSLSARVSSTRDCCT